MTSTPSRFEELQDEYSYQQLIAGMCNHYPGEPEEALRLRQEFPNETATQLFARMLETMPPQEDGPAVIPDPAAVEAWERLHPAPRKPAKKRKDGTFKAKRTKQLEEHTRQLSHYPAYRISARGDVWGPRGKKLRWRWFRCIPWVVLYDHEGRRHENQVFYLLVAAGWEKDWRKKSDEE
jgi:hypothetical protein